MLGVDWIVLLSGAALAFSVLNYVLLDGTDLGVGMLMGVTHCPVQRRAMALSILPIWDANETWLVLGGGGLLALFPMAYAVLLPALYLPFITMFMALIVRALALEFRDQASRTGIKRVIDGCLGVASFITGMCQGTVLGTLVQGVPVQDGQFAGSGWEWLSAFPLFCGGVLVVGYLWLGTCWLYWRTEKPLRHNASRLAKLLSGPTLILLAALVVWTSTLAPQYANRLTNLAIIAPVSALTLIASVLFFLSFRTRHDYLPLFCALSVFVAGFALMVATLFPLIVPPALTLLDTASGPASQRFMLIGFALLMPVTLFYNTYSFRVFSGKIRVLKK
jgi:cytochrome d ubiquinol oxidase subunit II